MIQNKNIKKLKIGLLSLAAVIFIAAVAYGLFRPLTQETEITTDWINDAGVGEVVEGVSIAPEMSQLTATDEPLTFESKELRTQKPVNAAALHWQQDGDGEIGVQMRTFNGDKWSQWVDADHSDDRKDGMPPHAAALVLANQIHKIQYRLSLQPEESTLTVNLNEVKVELIDTSKGPSPDKPKNYWQKLTGNFDQKASAIAGPPPMMSRADWGSPEPNGSPRWEPEYEPLHQVIVHHTVTTEDGDAAAAVRAIWHYHANSLGWGDIGYNYLVDGSGRIYQGRYFNPAQARAQGGDVVAGHAYGHNRGTTGIAAIGNFSDVVPSDAMLNSMGRIGSYKTHPYRVDPFDPGRLVGHRDATSTACPGDRMYERLGNIRNSAHYYYHQYRHLYLYDYVVKGQGFNGRSTSTVELSSGQTGTMYVDLQNTGTLDWTNSNNPVMLAPSRPNDRNSAFYTSDWVSRNRAATITHKLVNGSPVATNVVKPGETARFSFTVKMPRTGGTHREYFNLVREGVSWFQRDRGMYMQFKVHPKTYRWQWLSQAAYTDETKTTRTSLTNLRGGDRAYLVLNAKNTGNQAWIKGGNTRVNLGTTRSNDRASEFCDQSWINCHRPTTHTQNRVEPGQNATFEFWITVPRSDFSVDKREYFNLVAEGYAWMNDPGTYWNVRAVRAPLLWRFESQRAYTDETKTQSIPLRSLTPGQEFYLELKAENVGNRTWQRDANDPGPYPMRLGTTRPLDMQSPWCHESWLSCSRPAAMSPQHVAPGETATYEFWAKAPNQPGVYRQYFNLISVWNRWLNDPGQYWEIEVK